MEMYFLVLFYSINGKYRKKKILKGKTGMFVQILCIGKFIPLITIISGFRCQFSVEAPLKGEVYLSNSF